MTDPADLCPDVIEALRAGQGLPPRVVNRLRIAEAGHTPLPNPQRPTSAALFREADQVNRLTTENERLRARLRGLHELANRYQPAAGDPHAAVFRRHVLWLAGDSTDKPLTTGELRRMLADIGDDDQALAEISGQAPGRGAQ